MNTKGIPMDLVGRVLRGAHGLAERAKADSPQGVLSRMRLGHPTRPRPSGKWRLRGSAPPFCSSKRRVQIPR